MNKLFLLVILIFTFSCSYSQAKKYMRKARRIIEKSDFKTARDYYVKAYKLDSSKYEPNEGLGLIYAELIGNYEKAIPYLETALKSSQKDSVIDVIYALGKSYQHIGEYQKALDMYEKLAGTVSLEDDDKIYQLDVSKRKDDCNYALKNHTLKQDNFYIINAGKNINTDNPEYVPVITSHKDLIFTSKIKDTDKEKLNLDDGKYFESMYISTIERGKPQKPRRYTVPDLLLKSNFKKHHESIISMSPDAKILYIYKDGKIFEASFDSLAKNEPTKLSKAINFDYYQSHAYISKDGKFILFTSESEGGMGGIDIYKATKGNNGDWSSPENLGGIINTIYNEDAPYLSDNGKTLYFSSKGHPGYGGYDIYKSNLQENGEWSVPENLGLPINSPGDDVFFTNEYNSKNAYFSSYRKGGYGDMDIYKLVDLSDVDKLNPTENNTLLTLKKEIIDANKGLASFTLMPITNLNVISNSWMINDKVVDSKDSTLTHTFDLNNKENFVQAKIIAYCDTCFEPLALIAKTSVTFTNSIENIDTKEDIVINPYDTDLKLDYLNQKQLKNLEIDLSPVYFSLNKSEIREDAANILNKNIEILKQHHEISILIYGFADVRGSDLYNQILSYNRAKTVKHYLQENGIKSSQIKFIKGKGEKFLVNNCTEDSSCSDAEHEKNRRVELMLFYNSK